MTEEVNPMRYEQEMLEKIMYYDREGIISTFPLYVYRTKGSVSRKALEAAVGYAIQCPSALWVQAG